MKWHTPVNKQRWMVAAACDKQSSFLRLTKNETNPQIVELRNIAQGKLEAYEAVLQMMRDGCTVLIGLDTKSDKEI